jgi:TonB family protein
MAAEPPQPSPAAPERQAAYRRIHEVYPTAPRSLAPGQALVNRFEVCVATEGKVISARVTRSSCDADFDATTARLIATWRYSPLIDNGVAVPFCHPIAIAVAKGKESE